MVRPLLLVCSALSLTLAMGCTQPIEEGAASESSASSGTTPGPRYVPKPPLPGARYNVFVGTAPCTSIPGVGGTWIAARTFAVDPSFCAYWWANNETPYDLAALSSGLDAEGVYAESMVEDVNCENLMENFDHPAHCARPVVEAGDTDPGSGGGQYTCRSCMRGSYSNGHEDVNVVIPASLVTSTPSLMYGIFSGKRFAFWQPGDNSAFTVHLPKQAANLTGACPPAVVSPWSAVSAGGACGE
jgi:hypothetical protein